MRLAALLASLAVSIPGNTLAQDTDVPVEWVSPAPDVPAAEPAPAPVPPPRSAPAPTPAAPSAAPFQAKPPKSGGYVGFSVVTGRGTVYLDGQSADIDEALNLVAGIAGASGQSPTTLGLMLRVGWGSGDFLFGTQLNWIRSSITIDGTEAGYDFRGLDLVATWWSQEMGIYGRVGVGPSEYRVYAGSSESDPIGGVELMAGFGATLGSLGVGIDMIRQNYDADETGFDAVTYLLVGVSLDLY